MSFVFSQDVGSVKMRNQQVWYDKFLVCKLWYKHRYRPEIPEPVPSLFRHGAQIGGIRGFPTIKITVIHQVGMYCGLSVKIDMRETPNKKHTRKIVDTFCLCLFPHVWLAKTGIPPPGAPWLTTPLLHGAI